MNRPSADVIATVLFLVIAPLALVAAWVATSFSWWLAVIGVVAFSILCGVAGANLIFRHFENTPSQDADWEDTARRLAHEIKNPLSPIQLSMENLAKAHALQTPDFDQILKESTEAVLQEVARIRRTVDRFAVQRTFAQPNKGLLDMRQVVSHVVTLMSESAPGLRYQAPSDAVLVWGDRDQLTQVVVNVIKNAVEAGSPGSPIDIDLALVNEKATLTVRDQGPGLSTWMKSRAFSTNFSTKEQGSGLGLAISNRIIEAHGGSIRFATGDGDGASIVISLPSRT